MVFRTFRSNLLQNISFQRLAVAGLMFGLSSHLHAGERAKNVFLTLPVTKQSEAVKTKPRSYADPAFHPASFEAEAGSAKAEGSSKPDNTTLKANAGDDVLAFVGSKATLNGGQSQPAGRVGVRWIQISGPPVQEAFEQGPNLVVVPPAAGVYQFLLVVAEGGRISEPDTVTLTAVEHPEAEARHQQAEIDVKRQAEVRQAAAESVTTARPPMFEPVSKPETNRELMARLAAKALRDVPHSAGMGASLAELFSDISEKMSLYSNYAEAQQELSRRIMALLEAESADVPAWNRKVFEPLTVALSLWVRPAGLELADPTQWTAPLGPVARRSLADGMAAFAEGFREKRRELKTDASVGGDKPVPIAERPNGIQRN